MLYKTLTSTQRKFYKEYFALLVLKYYDRASFDGFIKSEAPDLVNSNNSIGIEVTEVDIYNRNAIYGAYNNFSNSTSNKDKERNIELINMLDGKIDDISITFPTTDLSIEKEAIKKSIYNKLIKYKKYKNKGFEVLSLFLYCSEPIIPSDINHFAGIFKESFYGHNDIYSFVYFTFPCSLMIYNVAVYKLDIFPIDRNEYERLKVEAKLMAEKM